VLSVGPTTRSGRGRARHTRRRRGGRQALVRRALANLRWSCRVVAAAPSARCIGRLHRRRNRIRGRLRRDRGWKVLRGSPPVRRGHRLLEEAREGGLNENDGGTVVSLSVPLGRGDHHDRLEQDAESFAPRGAVGASGARASANAARFLALRLVLASAMSSTF